MRQDTSMHKKTVVTVGTPERHIIVGMDRSPPSQAESGANEGLKENLRRSPNQRCEC